MRSLLLFAALVLAASTASADRVKRTLPSGAILAGYAPSCNETLIVETAKKGVNVIYWFASNLKINATTGVPYVEYLGPDFDCAANVSLTLRAMGLNTTHMVSIGGWNAPHPDTNASFPAIYAAWKEWNEKVVARPGLENGFDGVDWDLEGQNDVSDPGNYFTVDCLDLMGQFSQMAQADGYIVTMVPPESYLDPTTTLFDRSLLHAYPDGWQPTFKYHGHNAYAYVLSRYGATDITGAAPTIVSTFDLVLIQLYETFSHIDYNVTVGKQDPAAYLEAWVPRVVDGWFVDFSSDPAVNWPTMRVNVPAPALLVGFANGWAGSERSILVEPSSIGTAHGRLADKGMAPRGYFYWDINDEGRIPTNQTKPLYFAAGINKFLKTRRG